MKQLKQLCHVWFLKRQLLKQTFQWVIKSRRPHFRWALEFLQPLFQTALLTHTFWVLQPREEGPKSKCTLLSGTSSSPSSNVRLCSIAELPSPGVFCVFICFLEDLRLDPAAIETLVTELPWARTFLAILLWALHSLGCQA